MMMGVQAQVSMYVWQNGQKIAYPIYLVDSITFGEEAPFAPLISVEDGSVNDWIGNLLSVLPNVHAHLGLYSHHHDGYQHNQY